MSEQYYEMDCGCRFRQYGTHIKEDGFPPIEIDFYNLPDCPLVWDLLKTGRTKGVFQLESNLGQTYSQKLEPETMEDVAALTAIIRPSSLDNIIGGKSLTEHYCDRKNKREDVSSLHPILDKILDPTQQILVFQEQAILISREVAGFSMIEGDDLRSAIGKKLVDKMKSLKDRFIDGCMKKSKLSKEDAEYIFDIIEKSQNYGFNKSHAVEYGHITYATAYVKSHFPKLFYTSWLHWAKEKIDPQEEMSGLIADAKYHGHNIFPPSLDSLFVSDGDFCTKEGNIYFGLSSVKGMGRANITSLITNIRAVEKKLGKKVKNWTWKEFLLNTKLNKTVMTNLILLGSTPGSLSRKRSMFEYKLWSQLTDRESKWMIDNQDKYDSMKDGYKLLLETDRKDGGPANVKRKEIIKGIVENINNPKYNLEDDQEWIARNEAELLSVSLSAHILDSVPAISDYTIKEFLDGGPDKGTLVCKINQKREHIIKNGNAKGSKMCFLLLEDQTGQLDSVMFSNVYEKYRDSVFVGNIIAIQGKRSDKNKDSLIINKIEGL